MNRKQQKIQQERMTNEAHDRLDFLGVDDFNGTTATVVSTDKWFSQLLKEDLSAVGVKDVQCKVAFESQKDVVLQEEIAEEIRQESIEENEESVVEETESEIPEENEESVVEETESDVSEETVAEETEINTEGPIKAIEEEFSETIEEEVPAESVVETRKEKRERLRAEKREKKRSKKKKGEV